MSRIEPDLINSIYMDFTVAERLKLAREKAYLSQIDVMNLIGVNNKSLSGYESGRAEPNLDTLKILCDLYNVSADWILGRAIIKNSTISNNEIDLSEDSFLLSQINYNGKTLTTNQKHRLSKLIRLFIE